MYVNSINQQPYFGAKVRLPQASVYEKTANGYRKVADVLGAEFESARVLTRKHASDIVKKAKGDNLFFYDQKLGRVYSTKNDMPIKELKAQLRNNLTVDLYTPKQNAQLAEKAKGLNEAAKRNIGPDSGAEW